MVLLFIKDGQQRIKMHASIIIEYTKLHLFIQTNIRYRIVFGLQLKNKTDPEMFLLFSIILETNL